MSSAVIGREAAAQGGSVRSRPRRKRALLAGAVVAVAAGGMWLSYDWWTDGRFIETTDDAYVGGNIVSVAPHVAGFVASVEVADNQRVRAGQVLIRLDPRDYRAAADHAEAAVSARAAALEGFQAHYVMQQSIIRQQEADLLAKTARAAFAQTDAERYRSLAQTSAGSRQDSQRSIATDQEARSAMLVATASLEAGRQQLKVLHAQIAEAEANVAQARADLQTATLNLDYTEIRSPIDGYVGNRAAQIGAYASQGSYLISVIPSEGLWVDANFKEDQLGRMAPGRSASIVADVLSSHTFRGHVVSLAPGTGAVFSIIPAENATGNFTKIVQRVPVRLMLAPGDDMLPMLRPGLSTTVSVDTRPSRDSAK